MSGGYFTHAQDNVILYIFRMIGSTLSLLTAHNYVSA